MSLQIRRGLEKYRLTYIPAEGELVYITDAKKLYVGDGYTSGGILITGTLPSAPPPPTTQPPTTQPPTTQPPTTQPPTTQPPTTQPPTTQPPPWNQQEIIESTVVSPKVRQLFQINVSNGRPYSSFTFTQQGTSNLVTRLLGLEGSAVIDVNLPQAKNYMYDVHFNASDHNQIFSITVNDYNEQVDVNGPVYDSQTFNFEFTECEPGSIVSLERSSDAVDYSLIGILGTINESGGLIAPFSETAGYWYYRFIFSTTNNTRERAVEVYSSTPYDGGGGGGDN